MISLPDVNDLFEQEYRREALARDGGASAARTLERRGDGIREIDIIDEEDDGAYRRRLDGQYAVRACRNDDPFSNAPHLRGVAHRFIPSPPHTVPVAATTAFAERDRRRRNIKGWLVAAAIVGALNLGLRIYSCSSGMATSPAVPSSAATPSPAAQNPPLETIAASLPTNNDVSEQECLTAAAFVLRRDPGIDELFTALNASFVVVVNKDENRTRLYGRRDARGVLLFEALSTDGARPGQKVAADDERTPEGIYANRGLVAYDTLGGLALNVPNIFDQGMATGKIGLWGVPAERHDLLEADVSYGNVFIAERDFLTLRRIIGNELRRTYVAIVSSSHPLAALVRSYRDRAQQFLAPDDASVSLESLLARANGS